MQMEYRDSALFNDNKFSQKIIDEISQLGVEVENIYNYPQDIEGVIFNNEVYIVQTRPQV